MQGIVSRWEEQGILRRVNSKAQSCLVSPKVPTWVSCLSQPILGYQSHHHHLCDALGPQQEFRLGKGPLANLKESFKGAFQIISGIQLLLCLTSCKWITAARINLSLGRKTNYKRLHIGFLLTWGEKTKRRRGEMMLGGRVLARQASKCLTNRCLSSQWIRLLARAHVWANEAWSGG